MKDFLINSQNSNNDANFCMKHTYTTYGESIDLFRNSTYDKNLCVDFVFAAPHVYQIYSCLAVSKSSTTFLPEASFERGLIQYDNKTLIKKANKINEQSKAIDDEGRFSGYASVFNVKDNTNDLVMPGAFRDNLKYPEKIRLLWQHDTLKPIGRVNTLYEDKHGLYCRMSNIIRPVTRKRGIFSYKKRRNKTHEHRI